MKQNILFLKPEYYLRYLARAAKLTFAILVMVTPDI
jgi:hypothetical protein